MSNDRNCCHLGSAAPESYEPLGNFETVNGTLPIYSSFPPAALQPRGILVHLPDGFGHAKHNLMLADKYAGDGWHTVTADYLLGDSLPVKMLDRKHVKSDGSDEELERARNFDVPQWLQRHPQQQIEELLQGLIDKLRSDHPDQPLFAVGYCLGGKYAIRLAKWAVNAAAIFHPSYLTAEDAEGIHVPLYAGLADKDSTIPDPEAFEWDLRGWLEKAKVDYTLKSYPDVDHGYASRPNPYDAHAAEQFAEAYHDATHFFQKYT
ncbi:hypothetical protein NW759_016526 [Fusarium solani]|nr:hypothetical protein NW759_016526 [Fusarium solani]